MTATRKNPRIADITELAAEGTGSFTDADRIITAGALVSIAESLELIADAITAEEDVSP